MEYTRIEDLPREKLIELIADFSKNWLAMDGVWFQSVESKHGMAEAMEHDENAWARYTLIEANRIKKFLGLPDRPGLTGLARALRFRSYSPLNEDSVEVDGNILIYRVVSCRVQSARKNKGMPFHPCKSVGIIEYSGFAAAIDDRITAQCVSCYPDITDDSAACVWKFTLNE
ncbi:MAG: DUF6125 family protein [Bacillota bacterium]